MGKVVSEVNRPPDAALVPDSLEAWVLDPALLLVPDPGKCWVLPIAALGRYEKANLTDPRPIPVPRGHGQRGVQQQRYKGCETDWRGVGSTCIIQNKKVIYI